MHVHPSSFYRSYLSEDGQKGSSYEKLQSMLNSENKKKVMYEILEKFAILSLMKNSSLEL